MIRKPEFDRFLSERTEKLIALTSTTCDVIASQGDPDEFDNHMAEQLLNYIKEVKKLDIGDILSLYVIGIMSAHIDSLTTTHRRGNPDLLIATAIARFNGACTGWNDILLYTLNSFYGLRAVTEKERLEYIYQLTRELSAVVKSTHMLVK